MLFLAGKALECSIIPSTVWFLSNELLKDWIKRSDLPVFAETSSGPLLLERRAAMTATQSRRRTALVIHSPHAGRAKQFAQAVAFLRQSHLTLAEVQSIKEVDLSAAQGEQWRERGIDLVIAAGGDGLIGGLLVPVVKSGLPLGILPLGTANDLARTASIPLDLQRAVAVIAEGKQMELDLGRAWLTPLTSPPSHQTGAPHERKEEHLFAHALTAGLNVHFARRATLPAFRQRYGLLSYPMAALEAIRAYRPIEVELHFEGLRTWPHWADRLSTGHTPGTVRCKAVQVTVVNAPIFWGSLQATVPGVSLHDRILDVVIVEHARLPHVLLRILRFFGRRAHRAAKAMGWHANYPTLLPAALTDVAGVHHVQAQAMTIVIGKQAHEVTLDGEVCGSTPLSVSVADERLRLLVPTTAHFF
jgi:diacylglycerol kinase (ATP)